jgi:hypothetical protein
MLDNRIKVRIRIFFQSLGKIKTPIEKQSNSSATKLRGLRPIRAKLREK